MMRTLLRCEAGRYCARGIDGSARHACRSAPPPSFVEPLEPRALLAVTPAGPEFHVGTVAGYAEGPSVAMDAEGDFVVAWTTGYDIYARRHSAAGTPRGEAFRVNSFTLGEQFTPSVALDADGDFVIAWTSREQDGSGFGVFAQRYDAAGVPQGGEFLVNPVTAGSQAAPSVAMDADGDFVIAWHAFYDQDGSGAGVFARRYNAAGAALGGEFQVNTFTAGHQQSASVAMDDDGDFVVAWVSEGQDGSSDGIYAQRYDAAGVARGDEFRVNTYTTGGQYFFGGRGKVAMDSDGDFVVTWTSRNQDGSGEGVHAQRYSAAGAPQGEEFRVNTTTASIQWLSSVAMDADGDFAIAWASYASANDSDVHAQRYSAAGRPIGGEFRVNTTTAGTQRHPSVALDGDGDFVVAWQGQGGSGYGIYAQRYRSEAAAPAVTAAEFLYQSGVPQRLRFTFSQDVGASLSSGDLTVQRLSGGGGAVGLSEPTYDRATNTATFAFGGTGVLPDGNYRATLLAAGVTNAAGTPVATNYVLEFFVLAGDINRDRAVNGTDFAILAGNFGRTGRTYEQGDLNGDGSVNGSDFAILAGNFGRTVPPPTAVAVATVDAAPRPSRLPPARRRASPAPARRAPAGGAAKLRRTPRRAARLDGASSAVAPMFLLS